jgi:tetratricopeptide (TPR) repeat protein/predicted Ser/Thr protein kinase
MTHAESQALQPMDSGAPSLNPLPALIALGALKDFGDCELLEEIARGGMGIVYRARQKSLDRIVAVKMILSGQFAGKDEVLRFRAEAESAARLQHPNIVRIHETGEHDGQPYFSMDYVEGGNLAALVREKPLPAKRAAAYVKTIAEAIHYAHEHGILHRDLKPSNVLIDHADQPHVTDFGLAKRVTKESFLTVTGQVMGSPSFMPPEQAGAKTKAGRYSDVYGLGAILFYLVTGRPPFVAESVAETLQHVLNTEPVSPRLLNPSVPQDIATICLKCLEKEPAKRFQTAQQLADELGRFLNDEPIHARPTTRPDRVWRWCRRKPALAGAMVVALFALIASVALGTQARRTEHTRLAEKRQNAIDKALLTAWSGDLEGTEQSIRDAELAGVSPGELRMLRGSVAMHRGDYREAAKELEQAWKLSPNSVAVCSMLIKSYALLGEWDKAKPFLAALEVLKPTTPEDFLFRGILDLFVEPTKALETLNEAVRRRPTGVALLQRGSARAGVAQDRAKIEDAEAAITDVNAAKALMPANAELIALSLKAHLIAAEIYEERRLPDQCAAAWRQVEADAAALKRYGGNQAAVLARTMYLKFLGDDPAPLRELRETATNNVTAYYLALAFYRRGDWPAALDVVPAHPKRIGPGPDFMRGFVMAQLPNGPQLASNEVQRLWRLNPSTWETMGLQLTLRLLGHNREAAELCRQARTRSSIVLPWRREWYRRLLDYNCGDVNEADLLKAAAGSRYNQSEANFFIGMAKLADGDRAAAQKHFRASVDTRAFTYFDYDWSGAFLARMDKDPNWPPWIPVKPGP